jgi:DNA polymerase elongation subunit (family B)
MNKEDKLKRIEELKYKANELKKEVDYYNALQLALKLVLNGSYGAFATSYFILFNNHVAGTITAQGRTLTQTMHKVNEDYWYNQWHLDTELHEKMNLKNITPIGRNEEVSIYADTDSLFVSFKPAMDHCEWRHAYDSELEFIHALDKHRYAGYFKKCLEEHAAEYGVENKQDFELERISESIINIAKKKYIQHIVFEDGIPYDRLTYMYPKGVELVRSSTPLFARDKIVGIVKYLFENPDTFNIRELLKLVKNLKKEFDLCVPDRIDEICMQSSCSNYEDKCLNDKDKLEFVSGAHFAVKSSAYHNYLLYRNKDLQGKYEFIKSGTKIKYYYVKDKSTNDIFAYIRGSYPIEMAPEIDLDTQFSKCILSPINSIIEPLGLPTITERLSVVMSIFGGGI